MNESPKKQHGGKRPGAGRKPLAHRKVTTVSLTEELHEKWAALGGSKWIRDILSSPELTVETKDRLPPGVMRPAKNLTALKIPQAQDPVRAGFPSPAESYVEKEIDLNLELIKKPTNTVFIRVAGNSMNLAGICDGDMLIVDRSKAAGNGDIVVMEINGEFTVKRYSVKEDAVELLPESSDPAFGPLMPKDGDEWKFFGVVTYAIKTL